MNAHPNATLAGLVVVLTDVLDRINNHYSWAHLSQADTLAVGGAIVVFVLYIGKRGLFPALKALVWGGLFGAQPAAEPADLYSELLTAVTALTAQVAALAPTPVVATLPDGARAARAVAAEEPEPAAVPAAVEAQHIGRVAEPPQPAT